MSPILLLLALILAPQSAAPAAQTPSAVDQLVADAAAMKPLASSPLATQFLAAVSCLPRLEAPRRLFYDKKGGRALTAERAVGMMPEELSGYEETEVDEAFFYMTRYGTPVAFVRPLEILGKAGVASADGLRLADFGFGSIGQLRALAATGAQATGIEVDSLLEALYSAPGDTGAIARCEAAGQGPGGSVSLVFGQFPAEADTVTGVGRGYDVFVSKNTLKRGYIHPEKPVDPRRLVHLGVDDAVFVRAVFELLKPGGRFLIYNLCPAPAPEDKPYIPWADGHSPFTREVYEAAGFVVEAFDVDDTPAARAMGAALGWGADMDLEADLFGTYTLLRRPAG